ncbi:hypothetical protein AUK04_02755 [Candidatus Roizmanbacteria bacterium CG2_30_33_16]|uniref:Type II toxin-antitoxin system HicA family toxin n=4 Tax=Candidatus Roizmaniibacteriota TaxID=1752723 RepID=A0A2H0C3Z9_9BACT|nr:type II toxin-antitoxin system HicA family toxin [Candidatus Roizmanbacteria bacterium]OIP84075.1 MAG: hypothetical protein AUK04_02755 [Candidatus Roizmanbacteria bacterium CG2_30_33_16]PIP64637.1 MAG: hypothetical protein COW96_01440 [Candidatus Roizmanbacteria bacterium CG22_combo_CG10-13_8_21_14_all_33_16]PIX72296.1 MAG: type II toxin-antitoxin system HicA family toxin [Candidatus Roizmanbacteria bacterium CG_4_10_14_3_um_filter_33_21]PJB89268.1 MAG: type II toxin-antitoxin system HicA f
MPKLYSARDVLKTLQRAGFIIVSQKGSHIKLKGVFKNHICIVIVPNHKQIAKGTFESILKQADMSHLEFESYYR